MDRSGPKFTTAIIGSLEMLIYAVFIQLLQEQKTANEWSICLLVHTRGHKSWRNTWDQTFHMYRDFASDEILFNI